MLGESLSGADAVTAIDEATAHGERERDSQASRLLRLFISSQPEPLLFHDERGVPYAKLHASLPRIVRLKTIEFRAMLAALLWKAEGKAPGNDALASAMNVLHYMALEGPKISLHNRVAWHQDAIRLDLADESCRAVKISKEGWTIEREPPTLFRRYKHQLPIADPVHGGDPWKLLDYLNVRLEDRLLLMVYVASLLIPDFPHPFLDLYGPQGAAKTTTEILLKELLDPSAVGICSLPRNERELVQILDHNYLPYFDNVSSLPNWTSDAFCRATTGMGFSKRQLYTDDEDVIYRPRCHIGVNGINIVAQRPDLLDRTLLIGLEQIPADRRRKITDLKAEFSRDAPLVLGGFLDTVVRALNLPEPKLERTFRMADFVSWGYRFAQAFGRPGEEFIAAYERNIREQAEEAARADIVAEVLLEFLDQESDKRWEGTATKLLSLLREHAETLHVSTRQNAWPKGSNALTRRLRILKEPLTRIGYKVNFVRGADKKRTRLVSIDFEAGEVREIASKPSTPSNSGSIACGVDDANGLDSPSGTLLGIQQSEQKSVSSFNSSSTQQREELIRGLVKASRSRLWRSREDCEEYLAAICDNREEARRLIAELVRDGRALMDPEGYWIVVR